MTARSLSHPPPRNTSRTAQKTTQNLQNSTSFHISAETVKTFPQDISTHKQDIEQKRRATTQLLHTSLKIIFL